MQQMPHENPQKRLRILVTGKHYPMCGLNFFKWALESLGHEVFSFGYYSGSHVPWAGNPAYPPQYVFPPDLALKDDLPYYNYDDLKDKLPWVPDLILQIDAGFHLINVPKDIKNALFATDPHFLDYTEQYFSVDYFFNPQPMAFKKYPKGIFLPWAHDPSIHKVVSFIEKDYDIVFVGALYPERQKALEMLSSKFKVLYQPSGAIYEECTDIYNRGKIAFNWSSNDDIPMRIFEGMGYGNLVLTNRLPGMELLFKENKHYLGFNSISEMMDKAEYVLANEKELDRISCNGYVAVEEHTYVDRVKKILKVVSQ